MRPNKANLSTLTDFGQKVHEGGGGGDKRGKYI